MSDAKLIFAGAKLMLFFDAIRAPFKVLFRLTVTINYKRLYINFLIRYVTSCYKDCKLRIVAITETVTRVRNLIMLSKVYIKNLLIIIFFSVFFFSQNATYCYQIQEKYQFL